MFLWQQTRERGPRPPVTLTTWVQGHERLQLAYSSTAWRGRWKKRDKITSTLWKLLTLCSPVVLHNLIFRVELVPLMSWYGHKWETGFDRIHLQIILVHCIGQYSQKSSYKCPASTCEVQRRLDILIVSRGSVTQCPAARCQEQSYIVVTFPPRPPPVLCVHPLTHTPSVHTLITRGSCNKIPSLYPPILPYLTSFKNASILHAFSFPFKF